MKPFDPDATCPKCGYERIHTNYCEGGGRPDCYVCDSGNKHLDRRCERCGYQWPEKCIPKAKKEKAK